MIMPVVDPAARRAAIAKAEAGELLSGADLQLILQIGATRYHQLRHQGAFKAFKVKPDLGTLHCYAGVLVSKFLRGEEPKGARPRQTAPAAMSPPKSSAATGGDQVVAEADGEGPDLPIVKVMGEEAVYPSFGQKRKPA